MVMGRDILALGGEGLLFAAHGLAPPFRHGYECYEDAQGQLNSAPKLELLA